MSSYHRWVEQNFFPLKKMHSNIHLPMWYFIYDQCLSHGWHGFSDRSLRAGLQYDFSQTATFFIPFPYKISGVALEVAPSFPSICLPTKRKEPTDFDISNFLGLVFSRTEPKLEKYLKSLGSRWHPGGGMCQKTPSGSDCIVYVFTCAIHSQTNRTSIK